MKDLSTLTNEQLKKFFLSFDQILSDVDGVLWNMVEEIPGSFDGAIALKKIGKSFGVVTNNTIQSVKSLQEKFMKAGLDIKENEIVTPILPIVEYLKKQNLQHKKIFVIGSTVLKDTLKDAGFELAENGPSSIPEDAKDFINRSMAEEKNLEAVLVAADMNINYLNLQKALKFLQDPEVLFLCGARDETFITSTNIILMGPGTFINILEAISQRKATVLAKRGSVFNDHIMKNFKITNCSRVLFIGDSISEDMALATQNKFQKLLVLSGTTTKNDIEKWTFPEEYKPEFYVNGLKTLHELIVRVFPEKF